MDARAVLRTSRLTRLRVAEALFEAWLATARAQATMECSAAAMRRAQATIRRPTGPQPSDAETRGTP